MSDETSPTTEKAIEGPRRVDLAVIESELAALWHSPKDPVLQGTVTRACMSNLIVCCGTRAKADVLSREIPQIVQARPSRVLLLVRDEQAAPQVEAFVSAQCFLSGPGKRICSEQVTVLAGGEACRRLPSIARLLLVGDVPTVLWWAAGDEPPLCGSAFHELAAVSDRVLIDTADGREVRSLLPTVADWVSGARKNQSFSDLAWGRTRSWRQLIGQMLDPAICPGALRGVDRITVKHGSRAWSQAWFLIAWLADRLGWQLANALAGETLTFRTSEHSITVSLEMLEAGNDLETIEISWMTSQGHRTATFDRVPDGQLSAVLDGDIASTRHLNVRNETTSERIIEEMVAPGTDAVFQGALEVARGMAEALPR